MQTNNVKYNQSFCEFFGVANVKKLFINEVNEENVIQQQF